MKKLIALFLCLSLFACKEATPPSQPTPGSGPSKGWVIVPPASATLPPMSDAGVMAPGQLTEAEKQRIKSIGTIKVGGDASYPPFVFVGPDGKLKGLSVDFLDEVTQKLGIKYEITFIGQRAEILKQLEEKKIDITLASRTSSSRPYLIATQPYEYSRGTIAVRKGTDPGKIKSIGAGRGYASVTWLKLNRPGLEIIELDDDTECLKRLHASRIEACIMGREMMFFLTDHLKIPIKDFDLTPTAYEYFLSFGVHTDNNELRLVLSKGVELIPSSRRREILKKWLKEPDS